MAPRTPSCRSGCPLWTWKRMTWCSCPNLSHRLAIAGVFVVESSGFMKNPCDSYHVICHMRERDHEWKLYIYRSFIMYMYVPKNANNTSQNSQCVCVGVAVVFANDICKHARKCPRLRQRVWQILLASRIWDAMLLSNDLSSFMWCCFLRFQMIDDGDGEISVEELLCSKMMLGW